MRYLSTVSQLFPLAPKKHLVEELLSAIDAVSGISLH